MYFYVLDAGIKSRPPPTLHRTPPPPLSLSCDNPKCLQTLPDVPLVKLSPVQEHLLNGTFQQIP